MVTAAYLAAEAGRDATMTDFVRGVAREYNKLGLLCLEHEFGPWHGCIERMMRPAKRPTLSGKGQRFEGSGSGSGAGTGAGIVSRGPCSRVSTCWSISISCSR